MPAENPREPRTLPESVAPPEPDTNPDASEPGTPPDDNRTLPHHPAAEQGTIPEAFPVVFHDPAWPLVSGYQITGEIARGGMGVVFNARDLKLDREVAVKVLLPDRASPAASARFVTEAKVTARLPHPGVPPLHHLGELADGSPFLAMKLIRGRTLSELLKSRRPGVDDVSRFVQVFEQICQTVGFAHARGVIHRDLKPLNVMVGEFGEVQVMDWGLARIVSDEGGGRSDDPETEPAPGSDSSFRTQSGAVLGTPGYMAPEQARGEPVDCRTDVFSLGALLCAILTGKPAHVGTSAVETVRKAAAGDVSEALARLNACGADPELVALARRCLSPDAQDRPADGKAVADAVAAYRSGVEERLQTAERERSAAEARAAEQRKRRMVQLALFAALGLLLIGGGAFAWYSDRQAQHAMLKQAEAAAAQARLEAESAAANERARQEQLANERKAREGVPVLLALAAELRKQFRFREAAEALDRATALLAGGVADDLRQGVEQAKEDLAFVKELDDLRYGVLVWVSAADERGLLQIRGVGVAYRKAFFDRGLDPRRDDMAERINASAVRTELLSALFHWLIDETNPELKPRLLALLKVLDPDWPWNALGGLDDQTETAKLLQLAKTVDVASLSPGRRSTFATWLELKGFDPSGLLTRTQLRFPNEFEPAFELGLWYLRRNDPRAVGAFATARALRPQSFATANNLGQALANAGDFVGAESVYRAALAISPTGAAAHNNLGLLFLRMERIDEALAELRTAVGIDPKHAGFHHNLGAVLAAAKDPDAALASFREALRLNPKHAKAQTNIGVVLQGKDDLPGAIAAHQAAIKIDPQLADAHTNLGVALQAANDLPGAIAAHQTAIKISPNLGRAHYNLAIALLMADRIDEAIEASREAIRINPDHANAHYNLGIALFRKGDYPAAAAAFREVIRITPNDARAHTNLAAALVRTGDYAGARKSAEKAVEVDPSYPTGRRNLGDALHRDEELKEAEAQYREAARLDPKRYGYLLGRLPLKPLAPLPREVKGP